MPEPLADRIVQLIDQAATLYSRLVVLVAPAGSGKTAVLRQVHERTGAPLISVNLELSRHMLDLTARHRVLQLQPLLNQIVITVPGETALLDNTEMLFDVALKHDPLMLLKGLSRHKTVVASWSGSAEGSYITYAAPGHPEYRRYRIEDFLLANLEDLT